MAAASHSLPRMVFPQLFWRFGSGRPEPRPCTVPAVERGVVALVDLDIFPLLFEDGEDSHLPEAIGLPREVQVLLQLGEDAGPVEIDRPLRRLEPGVRDVDLPLDPGPGEAVSLVGA